MNTYQQIKNVLKEIYQIQPLNQILIVHGGIIPYLITQTDSNRLHGDIDFVVEEKNMTLLRKMLKKYKLYDIENDSLSKSKEDYGVNATIRNIDIGFYPFKIFSNGIEVKSFSILKDFQFKKRFMEGLTKDDFIEFIEFEGSKIGITTRELNYLLKSYTYRDKDLIDLEKYKNIEMNLEKIERLKNLNISKYADINKYIINKLEE